MFYLKTKNSSNFSLLFHVIKSSIEGNLLSYPFSNTRKLDETCNTLVWTICVLLMVPVGTHDLSP